MIALPSPVSQYFAAAQDRTRKAFEVCFAPDAVVHDEGKTYSGIEAIKAWHIAASDANSVSTRILSMRRENGTVIVTAEVSGSFKGSPVMLDFAFALRDDVIAELEIH